MKNDIWEENLKQSLQQIPVTINEAHFDRTITLAQKEALLRQGRERISFFYFLWKQIKFMGYKLWIGQGIFLFLINRLLAGLYESLARPLNMVKVLFCLSVLVIITVLPFLYHSVRYQMQEIEAASRFSCAKLLLAKLIVIGIGDISVLGGIFLTTIIRTSLPAESAFLYLCFPFLLAGSGCLFLLRRLSPRQFLMGSFSFCSVLALVFCMVPGQYAFLFQQSFSAEWMIICTLLFICCVDQVRSIIRDSAYTETQVA